MCQYRFYYYGGCQHQESVLYSFCENATLLSSPADQPNAQHQRLPEHAPSPAQIPPRREEGSDDTTTSDTAPHTDAAHAGSTACPSHSSVLERSSPTAPSSILISSTSLQEATPGSILSSTHHISKDPGAVQKQRSSDPAMAGLAPFSHSSLHQLMTGKSNQVGAPAAFTGEDEHSNTSQTRRKSKSWCDTARDAEDAEESIGQHVGNAPSITGASSRENSEAVIETFETLSAEIEAMRVEVRQMQEEATKKLEEKQRRRAKLGIEGQGAATTCAKTKIPAPVSKSAAAILQMEHEKDQDKNSTTSVPSTHSTAPPPSPLEFPELAQASFERHANVETSPRKLSYASMATTGMMDAISERFSTPTSHYGGASTSDGRNTDDLPSSHATASGASPTQASTESDVFMSPTSKTAIVSDISSPRAPTSPTKTTPTVGKSTPVGANVPSLRNSPRFAQPTMASNIRTGETLRKDSVVGTTPEGSPTKSMRTLTQRNVKRPSLPGGWMGSSAHTVDTNAAGDAHMSDRESLHPAGHTAASASPTGIPCLPEPAVGKKTSTYMSPTKAAVQRSMITLGQDKAKRISPRKALPRLSTAVSPTKNMSSPESVLFSARSTVSSASENIITEFNAKRMLAGRGVQLASKAPRSIPVNMRNPGAAYSRSSSDIRRRMTLENFVSDALAGHALASSRRPSVANTTKVRRESTGNMLNPIKAKLEKLGLLNEKVHGKTIDDGRDVSSPRADALRVAHGTSPCASPVIAPEQPSLQEQRRPKVVPPHRRNRTTNSTEAGDSSRCSSVVVITGNKALPMQTHAPSLRATAQIFTPMSKASITATADQFKPFMGPLHHHDSPLGQPPTNAWSSTSEESNVMMPAQEFNAQAGFPMGNHRPWVATTFPPPGLAAMAQIPPAIVPEPLPTNVQAGQILRPNFIPEINGVQWTMQDTDGHESLVNFGRAAAPPMVRPETPIFSPRSDDTSPRRTPGMSPWTIGASIQARARYGWKGGDGREIRFVGYGPDAERESNPQLNPNYKGPKAGRSRERGPRMVGQDSEDDGRDAPLAPRSRQQWAALMGYNKVPCSNVEVVHAVEQLPMSIMKKGAGYCGSCVE